MGGERINAWQLHCSIFGRGDKGDLKIIIAIKLRRTFGFHKNGYTPRCDYCEGCHWHLMRVIKPVILSVSWVEIRLGHISCMWSWCTASQGRTPWRGGFEFKSIDVTIRVRLNNLAFLTLSVFRLPWMDAIFSSNRLNICKEAESTYWFRLLGLWFFSLNYAFLSYVN